MDTSIFQCYTTTVVNTKRILIDNMQNFNKSINVDSDAIDKKFETKMKGLFNFKTDIIWYIALLLVLLHGIGIYGLFTFDYLKNPMTTLWSKYPKSLTYIPTHIFLRSLREIVKICLV